jgi:tRNA threonylcarbamoyladenosine biosynthesis protein TsaE
MRWRAQTAEDMEALGAWLAHARPSGNSLRVIYLIGELGAGKTTFARGYLQACGVTGTVRSPTYSLFELYELPAEAILHIDLYRLRDPAELETLGLREWARDSHTWLVEWPERGSGRLPPPDLTLSLRLDRDAHSLEVAAGTPQGEAWLRAVVEKSARGS